MTDPTESGTVMLLTIAAVAFGFLFWLCRNAEKERRQRSRRVERDHDLRRERQ